MTALNIYSNISKLQQTVHKKTMKSCGRKIGISTAIMRTSKPKRKKWGKKQVKAHTQTQKNKIKRRQGKSDRFLYIIFFLSL